jgi:heme exporter protein CcmD
MTDVVAQGGKYAAFIWGAYGVSGLVLAWMVVDTLVRSRAARRALERLERTPPAEANDR